MAVGFAPIVVLRPMCGGKVGRKTSVASPWRCLRRRRRRRRRRHRVVVVVVVM